MSVNLSSLIGGGGGGEFGFTPKPSTKFSTVAGGIYGEAVTSQDISTKKIVSSGTGKFLIYHIGLGNSGTGGNLFFSLKIDGEDKFLDFDTGSTAARLGVYSSVGGTAPDYIAGGGTMPPILVKESYEIAMQKTGATNAFVILLIIPIE